MTTSNGPGTAAGGDRAQIEALGGGIDEATIPPVDDERGVSTPTLYRTSPVKRSRRTKTQIAALHQVILDVCALDHPLSVRGVFYRVPSAIQEYGSSPARRSLSTSRCTAAYAFSDFSIAPADSTR